ncbi:MAG TPA: sigma 54 modulation/S30EA ribosomal C-terminal domain-containing protein [Candidatus Syntrophosphaera thermopropionivorans]|nr:sigma 54 modulation/S30EA ribosomal C-terminal domain-containing protein [Candidatus Syntrophosphaera thermopropionivorans]HQP83542.1 sigma 54 modulation/S30EA ribosomal C-terminal domain-containing protein [Candidatus Syntrophosphaera thermopropionivorans]
MDKLDRQKENFLIFRNVETDKLNVLVKKDEQNYKLIEP